MSYLYDADGRRVARLQNGAVVKQYYYDAAGHMITEANASGATLRAEIYAGGRHLATWNSNTTYFNHADWLGTERARTNSSGSVCETITSLPFGDGEVTNGGCTSATPTFFTGLERDSESGLDHTLNRQFASSYGRWLTPDPAGKKAVTLTDPQSWNMYAYVRNNPLRYADPSGLDAIIYISLGNDLTGDQLKFVKAHMKQIQSAIADKFAKAGVKNVEFRDASTLTQKQLRALSSGRGATGVSLLTLATEHSDIARQDAPSGAMGYTDPRSARSEVYLGHFAKNPTLGCNDVCAVADVAAHELGHRLGFYDPGGHNPAPLGLGLVGGASYLIERAREKLSGEPIDIMLGGQGQPGSPEYFNMNRVENQRAVDAINAVGDMTPQ